jgi:hypothetical protein
MPVIHVNSRYIDTDTHDLDVYDFYSLNRAITSLADHINFWMGEGKPEMAQPYIDGKNRIKRHLGGA